MGETVGGMLVRPKYRWKDISEKGIRIFPQYPFSKKVKYGKFVVV